LPLLLDVFQLTYHFIAEDNLLVITDAKGAGDTQRQVLEEIRDLHRDVHDLQDLVNELRSLVLGEDGPAIRKPTLIEDVPPLPDEKPAGTAPETRSG
jgi:hypothetical protein